MLIVGAGVGGLSLAGFLREAGLDPVVVERTATLAEPRGVVELWPEAVALLRELGVAAALQDHGATVTDWTLRRGDGAVTARRTARGEPVVVVRYPRLRAALCSVLPPRTVSTATTLHAIEQTAATVRATFANGVTEQFDVVVGADGADSRTRALLGGAEPTHYGTTTWVVPCSRDVGGDVLDECWRADTVVRTVPTGTEPTAVVTRPTVDRPGVVTDEPPAAVARVADHPEASPPTLATADVGVDTGRWTAGRVALLGDAAHAVHPLTGLGATLAVEDAAVLRTALLGPHDEPAIPARLTAYETARRARLRRLRSEPAREGPFAGIGTPLTARHQGVARLRGRQVRTWFRELESGQGG